MRLATKLALVMTLCIAAILSVQAILHVRRVLTLHNEEVHDDLVILGRALSAAVSEIYRNQGRKHALAHLRRADSRRERTQIELLDHLDAHLPADFVQKVQHSGGTHVLRVSDRYLVAYASVNTGDSRPAFLKFSRILTDERQFIRGVFWTQLGTTAVLIIVVTTLTLFLGLQLVGRRVESLINQARRVSTGDFHLNDDQHRDELGSLAQEMNQMTRSLETSQQRAREERQVRTEIMEQLRHSDRLSTIGKLASSIAHELGTPLNVVSGRASMIAGGEVKGEEALSSAQIIAQQAHQMTQIIRQLLDFSRDRGFSRQRIQIQAVLEQAVTLMEPLADKQGVSIRVQDSSPIEAAVDRGKLLQVLTNLMMNGIQAMRKGGTLSLRVDARDIQDPGDIHAVKGRYACVEIQDQGVGISPAAIRKIFQPFFTTKTEGEGTGLGLPVCHGIVREHGGWIAVDSKVDEGSRFTVFLPQEAAQ